MEDAPIATVLSRRRRGPRKTPVATMRHASLCAVAVVAAALFGGDGGVHAAVASSSSSGSANSSSFVFSTSPVNGSAVPSQLLANVSSVNATAVALADDNETITFESVLLTPENMLLPHLQQLESTQANESIPVAAMKDVERIPIVETSDIGLEQASGTHHDQPTALKENNQSSPTSPVPSATNVTAGNMTTDHNVSSASSTSGKGDTPAIGERITESPAPVIEVHGVPSPPTLVTAAASDSSADVSWNTPDDDGSDPILEYEVAWIDEFEGKVAGTKVVSQLPSTVVVSQTHTATGPNQNDVVPTTTTISSLVNGRSYAFKVRARNVNGYSTWSAKSLAVSPLHPPDLCGRLTCSGHGTCFPMYQVGTPGERQLLDDAAGASSLLTDARCLCRPGFNPPDCSVKNDDTAFVWKVTEWGECDSGCGGGQRSRSAICWDVALDKQAASAELCPDKKPSLTRICNGMECGSKLVSVRYQVETSFDEVLFSPETWDAFEIAFTTEVAAALQVPRTRLEITAIRRGSIVVFFQILPASRVGEPSLNDIVERLQSELANATSTLRSQGTFARRVETTGVKLSFSIADQTVAGGAEDISIAGLIGTVCVLCLFVALFGLFLRKRHERIASRTSAGAAARGRNVLNAKRSEMKPMGIRTMA